MRVTMEEAHETPLWQRREARALVSALPDLLLGFSFLVSWIMPTVLGVGNVAGLMLVMMYEFISIHAAVVMGMALGANGSPKVRAVAIVVLAAFYTSFTVPVARATGTWWPVFALWGLTFEKMRLVLWQPLLSKAQREALGLSWVFAVLCYVTLCFVTMWVPLPQLGMTAAVRGSLGLRGSGLWVDEPHRMLAFGFLYFTVMALFRARQSLKQ